MAAVPESAKACRENPRLDQAAICLSAACLMHCLLVPVLLVLVPWISMGLLGEKWFHLVLALAIAPLSLLAFRAGFARRNRRSILVQGLVGLVVIVFAALMEVFHLASHEVAAVLTSVGGVFLILAHWRNLRSRACSVGDTKLAIDH